MSRFINHHVGTEWNYSVNEKTYIKVGPYGTDDMEVEFKVDGSIFCSGRIYPSLEEAYTVKNRIWIKNEESYACE